MIMERPSCIKEIKKLTYNLVNLHVNHDLCINNIKEVINTKELNNDKKLSKIKQICDSYGK